MRAKQRGAESVRLDDLGFLVQEISGAHGKSRIIDVGQFHIGPARKYTEVPSLHNPDRCPFGAGDGLLRVRAEF